MRSTDDATVDDRAVKSASRLALIVALLALLVGGLAAVSGLGTRWGLWHFRTGFTLLRWAVYAAIPLGILGLVAAVRTRPGQPARGFGLAGFALVVGLGVIGIGLLARSRSQMAPIHDITTDPDRPPEFVAIVPLRGAAANPIEYGGAEIAAQQRTAYPDIQPTTLNLEADDAFRRALDAAQTLDWRIVAADSSAGRIEATDRTLWFGFRSDIVIRLTPHGPRTVVDVRSVSREGRGDAGSNARRIRRFTARLRELAAQ